MERPHDDVDCIIIGGGPAGLSAALVLGRCRRRVVVVDAGSPRNQRAAHAHGLLSREGTSPAELLRVSREQLAQYDVAILEDEVVEVIPRDAPHRFAVSTRAGRTLATDHLLLATGMRDRVPEEPGFREVFGRGVYVCPYCDGWENRDRRLVAYAPAASGPDFALGLTTWSRDVTLVTPGQPLSARDHAQLEKHGITVYDEKIARLVAKDDVLHAFVLASGREVPCDAVFVHFGQEQRAPFAEQLGCQLGENGTVVTREGERAGLPGVFVAGDASHDLQLIAVAVAEGVKAACAINTEMRRRSHSV